MSRSILQLTVNVLPKKPHTSSSHVFRCDGGGGIQTWPFSRELSRARNLAREISCLTRLFLAAQFTIGDSDPVISTGCGTGFDGAFAIV
jgi:hypothetical protein